LALKSTRSRLPMDLGSIIPMGFSKDDGSLAEPGSR
jgi:hypothetical protein